MNRLDQLSRAFGGVSIHESLDAVQSREDWSKVRSPGRARRRRVRGFPQRIEVFMEPAMFGVNGHLFVHPEIYAELQRQIPEGVRE